MTQHRNAAGGGRETLPYTAYDGYAQVLPTAAGAPMTVVIDATAPSVGERLWGMSLLERNVRLVERLGAARIHIVAAPERQQDAARRRFPGLCEPIIHAAASLRGEALRALIQQSPGPLLVLQGHVVHDRRLIGALWQRPAPCALVAADGVAALLLAAEQAASLRGESWDEVVRDFLLQDGIVRLAPEDLGGHISLLRKSVPPRLIRVTDRASRRRADAFLVELAGKGVNDLIAEFIHPPIEFLLTRVIARTRVTPNQVSLFNALLSIIAIPLLATGWLWTAIAANLLRGVTDGVDGKLARLTLRESTGGDHLDHVVDRLYLPTFFLALGYHLGGGDWLSRPAQVSYLLLVLYALNRLFASWFAHFVGASSGEFRPIDRLVRRIWPKRNICVWLLLISMLFDAPMAGLYAMTVLTGFMLLYRGVRLDQEGRRLHRQRSSR